MVSETTKLVLIVTFAPVVLVLLAILSVELFIWLGVNYGKIAAAVGLTAFFSLAVTAPVVLYINHLSK